MTENLYGDVNEPDAPDAPDAPAPKENVNQLQRKR